jgi:hypothetical protein
MGAPGDLARRRFPELEDKPWRNLPPVEMARAE